jgi:hypothetical protein
MKIQRIIYKVESTYYPLILGKKQVIQTGVKDGELHFPSRGLTPQFAPIQQFHSS